MSSVITRLLLLLPLWRAGGGLTRFNRPIPQRSLAELCDPRRAPADLLAAHAELDRAVDRLYRPTRFTDEHERLAHLLARHAATR